MLRIKLFIFCFVLLQSARSQTGLIIQGASPDLHLVHTVVAKENWYSIGRIYNLSPKELAPYNKTTLDKPLNIGQLIRIPLTATNFSQNGAKLPDESFIPLYYIVQEKEGMYRISVTHNKVSADNIKKWNSLGSEQLKNGMKLVVGYLKVKGDQSPFASGGSNKINVGSTATAAVKESAKDPFQNSDNKQADVKKTETATVPPSTIPSTTSTSTPANSTNPTSSTASKEVVKEENTPVPVSADAKPEVINPAAAPASHKGGFFKKQYSESGKTTTGNAGTFKSTSGWNDGKYYALMNNVPIGTIVKVSFSSTNKSIFAKVLGQLPEMKESTGLAVRLSDAAASELGVANSKFYVDVKY
ncbi:MAG TPA: LysM peptidoglycan-binding domain-containing protein [Flavitalea sp.]|nr:LysM peptidoglycan-binding domain-containing protein [Flavitalea sp.]